MKKVWTVFAAVLLMVSLAVPALAEGKTFGVLSFLNVTEEEDHELGAIRRPMQEILQRDCPEKKIYSIREHFLCPNMKRTTLEDVLRALSGGEPEIELPEEEMALARLSLERMISL